MCTTKDVEQLCFCLGVLCRGSVQGDEDISLNVSDASALMHLWLMASTLLKKELKNLSAKNNPAGIKHRFTCEEWKKKGTGKQRK